MAKVRLNPAFDSIHGRIGKIIHYNRKGVQYARSYAVPRNPDTPAQRRNRKTFAEAVKLWQGLSPEEKHRYNRKAMKLTMNGYNLFISLHLKENLPGRACSAGTVIRPCKTLHPDQLRSAYVVPTSMAVYREYPSCIPSFSSDHG